MIRARVEAYFGKRREVWMGAEFSDDLKELSDVIERILETESKHKALDIFEPSVEEWRKYWVYNFSKMCHPLKLIEMSSEKLSSVVQQAILQSLTKLGSSSLDAILDAHEPSWVLVDGFKALRSLLERLLSDDLLRESRLIQRIDAMMRRGWPETGAAERAIAMVPFVSNSYLAPEAAMESDVTSLDWILTIDLIHDMIYSEHRNYSYDSIERVIGYEFCAAHLFFTHLDIFSELLEPEEINKAILKVLCQQNAQWFSSFILTFHETLTQDNFTKAARAIYMSPGSIMEGHARELYQAPADNNASEAAQIFKAQFQISESQEMGLELRVKYEVLVDHLYTLVEEEITSWLKQQENVDIENNIDAFLKTWSDEERLQFNVLFSKREQIDQKIQSITGDSFKKELRSSKRILKSKYV
jgi:hypothetical protein